MVSDTNQADTSPKKYQLGKKNYSYDEFMNNDILDLMGAKNMSDEEKKAAYQKILDTIEVRVFKRVDDLLEDADIPEFKKILDSKDKDAMSKFLEAKKIDLVSLFVQESFFYKVEMVGLAQNLED